MWKILVSEVSLDVLQVIMFLDFAFTLRGPCPSTFMQLQVSANIWRWKMEVAEKKEGAPQFAARFAFMFVNIMRDHT